MAAAPLPTVLSVDHVSGQAMLKSPVPPSPRPAPAVTQGDGGEQGDPLMPALVSPAPPSTLSECAAGLQEGEAIFAFLDDTYVASAPKRTGGALEGVLWRDARIRLNQGKTRVWKAASPARSTGLTMVARDA